MLTQKDLFAKALTVEEPWFVGKIDFDQGLVLGTIVKSPLSVAAPIPTFFSLKFILDGCY